MSRISRGEIRTPASAVPPTLRTRNTGATELKSPHSEKPRGG
eukprot:CAMPEP_0181170996 /NCGR_PEP_ID=MMETSP1096-20121128/1666_1 /TAXON_ID=156174 ORGANISM="Chrysochromulina ericina, Strain CCMP281" /NCGR_SAMPLE_ID=MMETSP1096 /ASSEMBLY_ACC=CAM_ASM_000453 /LENGTH=41 /DNA_ID= /DNA_START= /DNA_END= /DNA_ORIENTATION=